MFLTHILHRCKDSAHAINNVYVLVLEKERPFRASNIVSNFKLNKSERVVAVRVLGTVCLAFETSGLCLNRFNQITDLSESACS